MKKILAVILILLTFLTPILLLNSLGNHEKLKAKIILESGYPYVSIGKYTLRGRSFTAYMETPAAPGIKLIQVEGYVGWLGKTHITKITDYWFYDQIM